MKDWRNTLIQADAKIRNALDSLNETGHQICLVVDDAERLIGTLTDGDIRRALLRSQRLDAPVAEIMNRSPIVGSPGMAHDELIALMTDRQISKIPIVDRARKVVHLADLGGLVRPSSSPRHHPVIILAGGEGARLRPLTYETPKPLLKIGGKPLLETTIQRLAAQGFQNIYISVNYKAEMIMEAIGDGRKDGLHIRYLRETSPLGTAGPIGLIKEVPNGPLVIMNGDLLTSVNLLRLLDFHADRGAAATVAVREQSFEIPYGVVSHEDGRFANIDEKPIHTFFVNAGIYIIEPDVLSLVPPDVRLDMTELLKALSASGRQVATFPIGEYWLDIGRPDDLKQADADYSAHFGKNQP